MGYPKSKSWMTILESIETSMVTWRSPILKTLYILRNPIGIESGWWFGTFFIFHNIWHNPSH